MKKILVLLAIAGACYGYWFLHRPISYGPGVLIASDPTQVTLPLDEPAFDFGDFHLKPLARFDLDARLLHSRVYRFDPGARLVPMDLAVGWGPMSDQQGAGSTSYYPKHALLLVRVSKSATDPQRPNHQSRN